MKQKIGIFGGTFDPIHIGHIIISRYVLEQRELDKIIFVPCNISPLKMDTLSSSPEHRLNMLKLAIEGIPQFDFSDYEILKGNVSFTYDTLLEMKKHYEHIELIIGLDNLAVFDKWINPDEIFDIATVVVMERSDSDIKYIQKRFYDKAVLLKTPVVDISSTEIRERVSKNLPINFLVPEKVREYILLNGLYS